MSSRESRLLRGRPRGLSLQSKAVSELRDRRSVLGIAQSTMAKALGLSQSQLWRIESGTVEMSVLRLAEMPSVLGLELSVSLYELGDPIRDAGQQAVGKRFDAIPSPAWVSVHEALLPNPGDRRSWDRLLRLTGAQPRHLVGADIETRIRDIQALVRRTRLRERDGNVDAILLVLSDSSTNRHMVKELREALGPDYATPPRALLGALRAGSTLPGSGVILI
jgi:transcriptional regulator with XRE-family HTH domain